MTSIEFRDAVIRSAEKGVREHYKRQGDAPNHKLDGSLHGLAICKTLTTREDFIRQLKLRSRNVSRAGEMFEEERSKDGRKEGLLDFFWRERYVQLQIEWVYENMRVWWKDENISARAGLNASYIVRGWVGL